MPPSTIRTMLQEQPAGAVAILGADGSTWRYGTLWDSVDRAAGVLAATGVQHDRPAAIVLPNGPLAAMGFLAAAAAGAAAPLNPAYGTEELEFYLDDLAPAAVLVADGEAPAVIEVARKRNIPVVPCRLGEAGIELETATPQRQPELPVPSADDVALLLHTSGTTSRPKLVPLTHRNLLTSAANVRRVLELDHDDRCLNVMPLFHIHGLVGVLLSSLSAGASVVCTTGFYATEFLGWLRHHRATWYSAVPTMHQAVLERARDDRTGPATDALRLIRSSSASLPPGVLRGLEERFGVPVVEAYGMTEAAHQICSNPLPRADRKVGSVGPPQGPEVTVLDAAGTPVGTGTGEVAVRGDNVTPGYAHNPTANNEAFTAGWFRTGDQGHLDEDGYLFLTGRIKEIINRGGEKVSPGEVDEVLLQHPTVAQAVTFAVPDARLGEAVAAAVVPEDGGGIDRRELRWFAATLLAPFKVPHDVLVLDELPTGPTGKLVRIGLAERLGIGSTAELEARSGGRREETRREPDPDIVGRVAALWGEVLRIDPPDPDAHFLDLGGDSMLATRLLGRVRDDFAVELPVLGFYDAGTVREQALLVEDALTAATR